MKTDFLKRPVRVLHLEDNENDHLLVAEMLRDDGLRCEFVLAKTRDEFGQALKRGLYDLIISDFSLPSYDGASALALAREVCPETPFVFFSGTIGEEAAVEGLKRGAADYVLKQRPTRLAPAIRQALHAAHEHAQRQRAEIALRQSEERFRIVAHATNDVVWEWDVQNDKVTFSENFKTIYGHHVDENGIPSGHWFDFVHPDDRGRVVTGISTLLVSSGRVWWSEHRIRRAAGAYASIFDRASVIYDPDGKPVKMVGVMIDMTERKQAEEKIREQAALLDKAQDAIIVLDLEDCVVYWNKSAERIYGWSAEEAVGQSLKQLFFRGDSPPELLETVRNVKERGEWVGELREFTKEGRQIIVQARPTLIHDGQGQPKGVLIINTDITERKLLEEQFLRAQRLESLGILVSGIAHDLNNTLSPILMGANMLLTNSPPPETESVLSIMEASARRSKEMVKQMLAFARGGELNKTSVNSGQMIKEMGRLIADTFPKSIQCRVHVDKLSWPVSGLPTQLHQVLLNLCVNARDAMPDGGTLTLSAENVQLKPADAALHPDARPGNYLCISVADTGTGIPAGQLDKIFEPFFTTKPPGKGTGLGLSTSLGIIRNHDGFMTVHSEVGRGTKFKIYLPAATERPAQTVLKRLSLPPGNGERILIVDDEEAFLAIMRSALENYSYKVVTASGGLEAVALFARNPGAVNLIITDLDMPFMDGRAVIAALRKIRREVKIIAASGTEKDAENFLKDVGPDAFISKPFTSESLLETVYRVLAAKK
ncbi:MAG TPA: PAS domain S-box protein [Verrucomicrobiae bacterium]|nr:PAS domain S-box protein [Verrucomicrobiae bacterium]